MNRLQGKVSIIFIVLDISLRRIKPIPEQGASANFIKSIRPSFKYLASVQFFFVWILLLLLDAQRFSWINCSL